MASKLFIYFISLLISTFAITGINFDGIIKKNHIWEARFLVFLFIIGFSYILTNFVYDIVSMIEALPL